VDPFRSLPILPALQMQAPSGLHAFYNLLKIIARSKEIKLNQLLLAAPIWGF
jgi:hypothetical protein